MYELSFPAFFCKPLLFKIMEVWEEWNFSLESENRLNLFCSKFGYNNCSLVSKLWLKMYNYKCLAAECFNNEIEMNIYEEDPKVEEIINLIKESLETNTVFSETNLIGISFNTLNRVLLSVGNCLSEAEFCTFCKFISSWSSGALVEEALSLVVLPKLKLEKDASLCIIFSIKELTQSRSIEMCQNVLIPLLSDESFEFTDVELLSGVFSVLQSEQQDLLIMKLTEKENFQENDWMLLQPLVKNLSHNSIKIIINCICNFSHKFAKSQVFGRFLVNFCKNLDFLRDKKTLKKAINDHQTLLKRQALKYLELV